MDGPDGYRHYWHDLRKDEIYFSKRHSGGGSIMVWGGLSRKGTTDLIELKGRANSSKYISTLNNGLLPVAEELCGKNWILQQDNAPIHTSNETKIWLKSKNIDVLEWPPYSPDLNPMENLWGYLVRKVYANNKQYDSIDELRVSLQKEWNSIGSDVIKNLVSSMPNRIFKLTKSGGSSIDY